MAEVLRMSIEVSMSWTIMLGCVHISIDIFRTTARSENLIGRLLGNWPPLRRVVSRVHDADVGGVSCEGGRAAAG